MDELTEKYRDLRDRSRSLATLLGGRPYVFGGVVLDLEQAEKLVAAMEAAASERDKADEAVAEVWELPAGDRARELKHLRRVALAAGAWWRARRPSGMSAEHHSLHPYVNLEETTARALAREVGDFNRVMSQQGS